jgi:hypothetical protein
MNPLIKGEFNNMRYLHPDGLVAHFERMIGTTLMEAQLLVLPVGKYWLPLASVCLIVAWHFRTVALFLVL